MKDLCVLILAAGKGTRMASDRAKVVHELCGKPLLRWVYESVAALAPDRVFVVVGYDAGNVRAALDGKPTEFVDQVEQLGTGHAVMAARE